MNAVKRTAMSLFLLVVMIVSVLSVSPPARASTNFDGILSTTPNLPVYTNSAKTETLDLSASWWSEFKESYALRVAQNIGWPANFVEEFEDVLLSGSWVVLLNEHPTYGNTISFVGADDPSASCAFEEYPFGIYYACTTDPGYGLWSVSSFTHNSYIGNGGCLAACTPTK